MSNLALFVVGVLITIPAAGVVLALLFAGGIDARAEEQRLRQADSGTTRVE